MSTVDIKIDSTILDLKDKSFQTCAQCKLPIHSGHAYEVGEERWHTDCFACSKCKKPLDCNSDFMVLGTGALICFECSDSCKVCHKKIDDLAIILASSNEAYCSSCFKCSKCHANITDLKYAQTKRGIFCISCHQKLLEKRRQYEKKRLLKKEVPLLPAGNISSNKADISHPSFESSLTLDEQLTSAVPTKANTKSISEFHINHHDKLLRTNLDSKLGSNIDILKPPSKKEKSLLNKTPLKNSDHRLESPIQVLDNTSDFFRSREDLVIETKALSIDESDRLSPEYHTPSITPAPGMVSVLSDKLPVSMENEDSNTRSLSNPIFKNDESNSLSPSVISSETSSPSDDQINKNDELSPPFTDALFDQGLSSNEERLKNIIKYDSDTSQLDLRPVTKSPSFNISTGKHLQTKSKPHTSTNELADLHKKQKSRFKSTSEISSGKEKIITDLSIEIQKLEYRKETLLKEVEKLESRKYHLTSDIRKLENKHSIKPKKIEEPVKTTLPPKNEDVTTPKGSKEFDIEHPQPVDQPKGRFWRLFGSSKSNTPSPQSTAASTISPVKKAKLEISDPILSGPKPGTFEKLSTREGDLRKLRKSISPPEQIKISPPSSLYGSTLSERCKFEGRDLPLIMTKCMEYIESDEEFLKTEGLYRKSGSQLQIEKIEKKFSEITGSTLDKQLLALMNKDIHAVAGVFKRYLRQLPFTLISFDTYDDIIDLIREENLTKIVPLDDKLKENTLYKGTLHTFKKYLDKLPIEHYRGLKAVLKHIRVVSTYSNDNLMGLRNLSMVFTPGLIKDIEGSRDLIDMKERGYAIEFILRSYPELFETSIKKKKHETDNSFSNK